MAANFFFYDLETTGFNPREARIMQFAGQRTDMELQPVGEPVNLLIRLTPEIVPEPDAIMVTGITPQSTLADGVTEKEFLELFYKEVVRPGTIFLGYNTVRFDDEFMRFLHYRNFYDAYEWQWCDDCSRWDILDLVRMTRALRPDGIDWPFTPEGKPTNRLELLTGANKLNHDNAHDALSDVNATIAIAKLVRDKQPELFKYLFDVRRKQAVKDLIETAMPFMYASGRYPGENLHVTAAVLLAPTRDGALVYDLRADPAQFIDMTVDDLAEAMRWSKDPDKLRLPVKELKCNHCPAVIPGVVKDAATLERIHLDRPAIIAHWGILTKHGREFADKVTRAHDKISAERQSQFSSKDELAVDGQLYGGTFFSPPDKNAMRTVRTARPEALSDIDFKDKRLNSLLPLYKARNFPQALSSDERAAWDLFCQKRLLDGDSQSRLARFFGRLQQLIDAGQLTESQQYLLEELRLYGESIMPLGDSG